MVDHNQPVISAALTRALKALTKQINTEDDTKEVLTSVMVHTETPTKVAVDKPKRTRKKVVD